jgi:hypothetical protein
VLKRLRQILWEGVGRLNDGDTSEESPPAVRAEQIAVASTPPATAAAGVQKPSRQHTGTTHAAQAPPSLHHEHLLMEALKRMSKHSPLQTRLALVNELCEYSRTYWYPPLGSTAFIECSFIK